VSHVDSLSASAPPPQQVIVQQNTGTNGMAVASFVLSLLWLGGLGSLLAVIFAPIAKRQMRTSGQGGSGLATAGLVIGIVGLVGAVIWIAIVIAAAGAASTTATCLNTATTLAQVNGC
jgi:hypothetical protein